MVRFTRAWHRMTSLSLRAKLLAMFAVWLAFTVSFGIACASLATAPLEEDEQRTVDALMCSEAKRAFVNLDADLTTEIAEAKERQQENEQARLAREAQPAGQPPAPVEMPVPIQAPRLPFAPGEAAQPSAPATPKFTYHHSDPGFDRPGVRGATTDSGMIRSYLYLADKARTVCGPWLPDTHVAQWRDVQLESATDTTVTAFREDIMRLVVAS